MYKTNQIGNHRLIKIRRSLYEMALMLFILALMNPDEVNRIANAVVVDEAINYKNYHYVIAHVVSNRLFLHKQY